MKCSECEENIIECHRCLVSFKNDDNIICYRNSIFEYQHFCDSICFENYCEDKTIQAIAIE